MPDKASDEFHDREGFFCISIILMAVVMESDVFPIVSVNAGSGNDRPAKVSANIFHNGFRVTFIRFSVNIKAMSVIFVTGRFYFFERRPGSVFHFIEEGGAEGKLSDVCSTSRDGQKEALERVLAGHLERAGVLEKMVQRLYEDMLSGRISE